MIKSPPRVTTKTALGVGYRPELALAIDRRTDLAFVEILAEDYQSPRDVPKALKALQNRGVEVLVHSISLSLGGAPLSGLAGRTAASKDEMARRKLLQKQVKHLNKLARYFDAPFVSDHIAFVRAGELESGHLLPLERNAAMLAILKENISLVKETLCVPLVLENIASTFDQPHVEMDEATFVRLVLEQSDCGLLLDLSNLFANSHNMQFSASEYLRTLPLERLRYVHLAGGTFKRGLYHDTHCHPLKQQSLSLLAELTELTTIPRVMLERDDSFPPEDEFNSELEAIKAVVSELPNVRSEEILIVAPSAVVLCNRAASGTCHTFQSSSSCAESIGARQKGLTRALLGIVGAPEGFDEVCLRDAAQALSRKRLRAIKRAHPCLAHEFLKASGRKCPAQLHNQSASCDADESALDEALIQYFADFPSVHPHGPYPDSQVFLEWLQANQIVGARQLLRRHNFGEKIG